LNVLVVDDSAVVRQALATILARGRTAVATAADAVIATQKIQHLRPDVIVLDIEMPRMDGLTFLRQVMASPQPIPVVVCSSLAQAGTQVALQALEEGAVAVVEKPRLGVREFLHEQARVFVETVQEAAQVRVRRRQRVIPEPRPVLTADAVLPPRPSRMAPPAAEAVVAIGASTGGTEALRVILEALPADAPGIVIVQHMPEGFTRAFAQRLDGLCRVSVKEAEPGDPVEAGRVLIAPGNRHLLLARRGGVYRADLVDGPPVSRHRPSVDVLFRSVAQAAGPRAVGVLLTGMGRDGADGLLEMRHMGAATLAQDEATSVVFGMPKEAIAAGAAGEVLPLGRMAARLQEVACRR
jgi:two-component system, chemotaxis family, protein-glutamate methylesterase/glutaminase